MSNQQKHRLIIVGGGISGLAAAWKARQLRPEIEICILEADSRVGGVLQTDRIGDYLVENAADMFTCQPNTALQLCRELGIEDDLLSTASPKHKAFVGLNGQVVPVPQGFSLMVPTMAQSIHDWPLLSEAGKTRLLAEESIPRRDYETDDGDEDFKSFAIRRFGKEAFDVLIQPLVSGIYSADPSLLSMNATMKRFVDMEKEHGSLIAAVNAAKKRDGKTDAKQDADANASGARYSLFRSPRAGFASLVAALQESFDDQIEVSFNAKVNTVRRRDNRWEVLTDSQTRIGDSLILATPAGKTKELLPQDEPRFVGLIEQLAEIKSTSCAIVAMGIDKSSMPAEFDGFGVIYPHIDAGQTIAISFSSNKFSGRAGEGKLLLRFFIGGAMQEALVDLDDNALIEIAMNQFQQSFGCRPEPDFQRVFRWKDAMPQYHVGHLDRVERIEASVASFDGLALAGKCYRGVGIPACLDSGFAAASQVLNGDSGKERRQPDLDLR